MTQPLLALLVVLACIGALALVLRACGLGSPPGRRKRMRVLETVSLGGRQRLHVVEIGGAEILVGSSETRVELIRELPQQEPEIADRRDVAADGERAEAVMAAPASRALAWAGRALRVAPLAMALLWLAWAEPASAQIQLATTDSGTIALSLDGAVAPERISSTLQVVGLLTLISVAPSLLLMGTCFTRILIVLALLRQALAVHQLPPNQVIVGLALFTTLFVMAPLGEQIRAEAFDPYVAQEIDAAEAGTRAMVPIREFLLSQTREKDLQLFVEMSGKAPPETFEDVEFSTLLPSYMISELRTAFEIGFMIYLPFLVIDLVVASLLIAMGMIVLPPMMISLPFKLMLFVLLDGWNLILSSLVSGLQ